MEEERKPSKLERLIFQEHFKITFRVIGITVGLMALLGGGGYLLDQQLGTYPFIFIGGLIIAFPVIQVVIYFTFKKLTDKNADN